jgi:hypothetical protein
VAALAATVRALGRRPRRPALDRWGATCQLWWCTCCLIEAPWLVNGGHGTSIRQPPDTPVGIGARHRSTDVCVWAAVLSCQPLRGDAQVVLARGPGGAPRVSVSPRLLSLRGACGAGD